MTVYNSAMNDSNVKILLELLSPAKDLQAGKIAVISGADAVYIGGPEFSARSAAGNSWDEIGELCSFAHQYYVKVYVALNTIFFDGEEAKVQNSLNKAYDSGADGVIIQDMGILKLDLPPFNIIASTQCNNADPGHIRFMRDSGFSRIILARELSLEQIRRIRSEVPDIELEAFIHGALCVSYSGRCYFSQYLSGRSANRGKCMQVCRLPFDLADADGKLIIKDKHLLSTKDLCMSGHLHQLIDAGVTSFKIEGRLKDASYVGNVTAKYSKELDNIVNESRGVYRRSSSGRVMLEYEPDLRKSFNRDFTRYFYFGRKESVISEKGQGSLGEFIGKVLDIDRNYFTLYDTHDLKNGDGICWVGNDGSADGVNINKVDGEKIFPFRKLPPSEGTEIFRNENPSFEKAVLSGSDRRVGVTIEVSEKEGVFSVQASDEDGNSAELKFWHDRVKSNDPETSQENMKKQFSKTGGTVFYPQIVRIGSGQEYFITVSVMNSWRREILETVMKERMKNYPRRLKRISQKKAEFRVKNIDPSYNVSNKLAEEFYVESGAERVERSFETSDKENMRVLMISKHCLKYHLGACRKYGGSKKLNEPLYMVLNGEKYLLDFDCEKCVMKIEATKKTTE